MAQWMNTLYLANEWKQVDKTESKEDYIKLLDKIISELKRISDEDNDSINELIDNFDCLKNNFECDAYENIKEFQDEFNYYFNDLYDWADISLDGKFGGKKNCWVKTF